MSDFKEFEKQAWEAKANRYEATWGRVSTQAIPTVLKMAGELSGKRLLDCGCGPGHLCVEAATRGAEVVGSDYSNTMIDIARAKHPLLTFQVEDAERLSFPDSSFDLVTMNFLLLHVSNQEGTLLEGLRVLRPGGKLIFSMWLPPVRSPGLALMFDAVKTYADMSVIPPAQDIFTFSDSDHSKAFLESAGAVSIDSAVVDTYWEVESSDEFFSAVQAGTRIGGTIDLQTESVKKQIKGHIDSAIGAHGANGRYHIPTPCLIVAAAKGA